MARYASINIRGIVQSGVNIDKMVGFAGDNLREDVMLIQALFNYIAEGLAPGAVGLGGDYKIPAVSGEIDADTYSAISAFQVRNASRLISRNGFTMDGKIHPASYKGRVIRDTRKPLIAITLLHLMATDAAVMQGHGSYSQAIASRHQELAKIMDMHLISE